MKHRGVWGIRSAAPSKRETLGHRKKRGYRFKLHKPCNVLTLADRAKRVSRMMEGLQKGNWKIHFTVEAVSPRGFRYKADGQTADEAFLKAFGQWRHEFMTLVPKIRPDLMRKKEVIATPPVKKLTLSDSMRAMLEKYGEKIFMPRQRSIKHGALYMRAYRFAKQLESTRSVAGRR